MVKMNMMPSPQHSVLSTSISNYDSSQKQYVYLNKVILTVMCTTFKRKLLSYKFKQCTVCAHGQDMSPTVGYGYISTCDE